MELGDFGMTEKNGDNETIISEPLWANFINLDETCISFDGSQGSRGGCPVVVFYDPQFPVLAKATSKSALTSTMIGGCTAKGEPLPPHVQFQTKATAEEREKVRVEIADCLYSLWKVWLRRGAEQASHLRPEREGGDERRRVRGVSLELNLHPLLNARLLPDHWVIIKVDSGPGRLNIRMLACLWMMGFIIYPGVPNTTSVTQESNRLYGVFKDDPRDLQALMIVWVAKGKSKSLQPWLCGLVIFGGRDKETGFDMKCAFEEAFSRAQCKCGWELVSAFPLTEV